MVNPVSKAHQHHTTELSKPTPPPVKQKPANYEVQDKVTLKSVSSDADHDGDNK